MSLHDVTDEDARQPSLEYEKFFGNVY